MWLAFVAGFSAMEQIRRLDRRLQSGAANVVSSRRCCGLHEETPLYAAVVACLGGYVFIGSRVFQASASGQGRRRPRAARVIFPCLERVRRDYVWMATS